MKSSGRVLRKRIQQLLTALLSKATASDGEAISPDMNRENRSSSSAGRSSTCNSHSRWVFLLSSVRMLLWSPTNRALTRGKKWCRGGVKGSPVSALQTRAVLSALAVKIHFPDRKSTRLNSSHGYISYAVFCLKK